MTQLEVYSNSTSIDAKMKQVVDYLLGMYFKLTGAQSRPRKESNVSDSQIMEQKKEPEKQDIKKRQNKLMQKMKNKGKKMLK